MNKIIILIAFILGGIDCYSQNIDSLSQKDKDSLLVSIAKQVVLKYGPAYYREVKGPKIERRQILPKGEKNTTGENANRVFYQVVFLYDSNVETLTLDFAAQVSIWADTGKPFMVLFGNGYGKKISEADKAFRSDEDTEPVPYQQRQHLSNPFKKSKKN